MPTASDILLFVTFQLSAPFLYAILSIGCIMFSFFILSFVAALFETVGDHLFSTTKIVLSPPSNDFPFHRPDEMKMKKN